MTGRHEEENVGAAKAREQELPAMPMLLQVALPVSDTAQEEAASAVQRRVEARWQARLASSTDATAAGVAAGGLLSSP